MKNANLVSRAALALATALLAVNVASCNEKAESAAAAGATAPKTVADYFPIKVADKTVRMQLAVHLVEMQRGLMGRRDLKPDEGMLFVYDKPQSMSFWMRNTPTPLDIGFFNAQGVLEEVYPMHPFDETSVASRSTRLQFALEMNQGWFAQNGVKPGARLDLNGLAVALKERGFEPQRMGIAAGDRR